MRTAFLRPLILAPLILAGAGTAHARADKTPDRLLAGRAPGKPVDCIQQTNIQDTRTFDDGSIYYRMRGGRYDYLNRPYACTQLNSDRAYATVTPSTQLCSGDMLRIFDAASRIPYGSCSFAHFIPYPKKK